MQVAVSFRHMETSPALRDYAAEKLEHVIGKYLRAPTDAQVVLSVEKFWHIAKFSLQVRGLSVKSEEKSEDMYSSIDLALDKLERQLRRYKDKIRNHRPVHGVNERNFSVKVLASVEEDEDVAVDEEAEDAIAEVAEIEAPLNAEGEMPDPAEFGYMDVALDGAEDTHVTVLRTRMHSAMPMEVSEAVMQLDLQDKAFLVFTNADTDTINVIYRRAEGNYGLIETNPEAVGNLEVD